MVTTKAQRTDGEGKNARARIFVYYVLLCAMYDSIKMQILWAVVYTPLCGLHFTSARP